MNVDIQAGRAYLHVPRTYASGSYWIGATYEHGRELIGCVTVACYPPSLK